MSLTCDWTVDIGVDQVLSGQGIDPGSSSPSLPALRQAALRAIEGGLSVLDPRVASHRTPVERVEAATVHLAGGVVIHGDPVVERLRGATELVLVVCTVGEAISRHASVLMETDPVAALAVEGLACAGVEALAAAFCRDERVRAAGVGHCVTAPISPGIDEWPLEIGQRIVFRLVDAASIGVRLSESGQMRPCKSSSFIVGVGKGVQEGQGSSCERCSARQRCGWSVGRRRSSGGL
jgi:hypothetical protein